MVFSLKNNNFNPASSGIVYLLFFVGLVVMAYSLITQSWLIFTSIMFFPLAAIILLYAIEKPMLSYVLYAIATCYFSAIYRYSGIEGLSGILDIFLYFCLFSIFINVISFRQFFLWKNGFNILTITYFIWIIYCILILLTPYSTLDNFITNRGVFITLPLTYFISSVLLCSIKKMKTTLLLLGIFIITAAIKVYWQKTRGWDNTEAIWLMEGAWKTHLLHSGIRYFSFYSDAGNFGSSMGMFTLIFGIISAVARKKITRWLCISVAILAGIGMMMSGTRGAIIVPFGGLILYILLNKSPKTMTVSAIFGGLIFCFFYFTDIGESNTFIRRMRTAFRPAEDASFNVRVENQKHFAYYLKDKPFGVGVGGTIKDVEDFRKNDQKAIPTDSFYVGIWVEGGIVGLCLYIALQILILLRCCYLIMFRIQNKQLCQILAAFLGSVFGVWLNGYVGRGMGAMPSCFIIAILLSFILNGIYIDKQLKKNEIII